MTRTIGIFHDSPTEYLPLIRRAAPEARLRSCTRWDGIGEILDDVEVLLAFKFGLQPFPREEILAAPCLRWVQLASAGSDHICPFEPQRLVVTNASGIHGEIMSQYVFGALLQLLWDFPRLRSQQAERRWDRYEVPTLTGKTMGILGLGSVGSCVARCAHACGMHVIGTRRSGKDVAGVDRTYGPDGLAEVLSTSDVVVVTLPLVPQTRGLIGAVELGLMRRDAYLVVISRGAIVDEDALAQALRERRLAGAVLDVFAVEPLPGSSPLWELPNTILTPHIAGELMDWPMAVAALFIENLQRYRANRSLRNVVDPEAGY